MRGGGILLGAGAAGATALALNVSSADSTVHVDLFDPMPTRKELVATLAQAGKDNPYDVLIIGGGASGTGCALDAQTRGLRTALVEQEDFGAGTSSRSTKLVHGGVRYLEKAVFNADPRQLKLVFEALQERDNMLRNAPHLSKALPILTPCYKWWEVPYFYAGLKMYDLVAATKGLTWSHYVSATESLRRFPTLAATHDNGASLKGTIVYYDGQFDDARYNVAIALTAALAGATMVNHAQVVRLLKDGEGKVVGAAVKDTLTGKEHEVHAKVVINATGPFADSVRKLSNPEAQPMILPSAGTHVTLPAYYCPSDLGMIIPKTKDGRVVFMLPWLGHTIAGTTDAPSDVSMTPEATEADVSFILSAIQEFLAVHVRRQDVLSAWSGVRPLAIDPTAANTADAVREHVVATEADGMVTVAGGKWTTYRSMAEDTVDAACASGRLPHCKRCVTQQLKLVGSTYHYPTLAAELAQRYVSPGGPEGKADVEVADHIAGAYGDRSQEVLKIAEERGLGKRLAPGQPVLEAEVVWAAQNELCETAVDFLSRRTRLAFVDRRAAEQALPKVIELMSAEKGWGYWRRRSELFKAQAYLKTFEGLGVPFTPVAKAAEEAQ